MTTPSGRRQASTSTWCHLWVLRTLLTLRKLRQVSLHLQISTYNDGNISIIFFDDISTSSDMTKSQHDGVSLYTWLQYIKNFWHVVFMSSLFEVSRDIHSYSSHTFSLEYSSSHHKQSHKILLTFSLQFILYTWALDEEHLKKSIKKWDD